MLPNRHRKLQPVLIPGAKLAHLLLPHPAAVTHSPPCPVQPFPPLEREKDFACLERDNNAHQVIKIGIHSFCEALVRCPQLHLGVLQQPAVESRRENVLECPVQPSRGISPTDTVTSGQGSLVSPGRAHSAVVTPRAVNYTMCPSLTLVNKSRLQFPISSSSFCSAFQA